MIYVFCGYETLLLLGFGLTADQAFGVILVSSTLGGKAAASPYVPCWARQWNAARIILVGALVTCVSLSALYFVHTVIAYYVLVSLSWGATEVWLFSMYNYTTASYPTRLRATGTGLTDGVGHLGAVFGPILAGWLFTTTAAVGHAGWFACMS